MTYPSIQARQSFQSLIQSRQSHQSYWRINSICFDKMMDNNLNHIWQFLIKKRFGSFDAELKKTNWKWFKVKHFQKFKLSLSKAANASFPVVFTKQKQRLREDTKIFAKLRQWLSLVSLSFVNKWRKVWNTCVKRGISKLESLKKGFCGDVADSENLLEEFGKFLYQIVSLQFWKNLPD